MTTPARSTHRFRRLFAALVAWPLLLTGCGGDAPLGVQKPKEVIVYTALDEEFSKPIFDAFTRQTGIEVRAKYDTEATKTVGLANAIIAERERPRCDVFWNNEMLHTMRLKQQGLLRVQPVSAIKDYPAEFRSPDHDWYGFAARARVLIVNTDLVKEARRPVSIFDMTDPQWYDKCGIAKPLFGTTATHAACLFHELDEEEAKKFFSRVKDNCRILSGNKRVAQAVAKGQLAFGLTDTDDAMIEFEAGAPVEIIYPDQAEGGLGTLFIPNSLGMIEGSPNPTAAHAMVEFLLTPLVECRLVDGPSAQIPLNRHSNSKPRVKTPEEVLAMQVDFAKAAESWESASAYLTEEFTVGP